MDPITLGLIIGLVQQAIKSAPALAAELKVVLAKENPTPADWAALKFKVQSQTFEQLAPNAKTE